MTACSEHGALSHSVIRWDELARRFPELRTEYNAAAPFEHAVLDGILCARCLDVCARAFPTPDDPSWFRYPSEPHRQSCKQTLAKRESIPKPLTDLIDALNAEPFVEFLKNLTGIPDLTFDEKLHGGGLHQTTNGGSLGIHVDHALNPMLNRYRRVTVLIYVSRWRDEYGGQLELWDGYREGDTDRLIGCVKSIAPSFNRMVIFSNSNTSYHGHPGVITCPEDVSRNSIATFYLSDTPHWSYSVAHDKARFVMEQRLSQSGVHAA